MQLLDLRCEYRSNPLGLDVLQPRLSWKLADDRRGARQTAYQVLAAASPDDLAAGRDLLWDSGRVESAESIHVPYAGPPLASRQRVWWQVRAWDQAAAPGPFSAPAWWEMGLLERADWQAEWIGASLVGGPRTTIPCPYLRRAFTLSAAPESARLYVTALGLYDFNINGQRVSADLLAPGWTDYSRRVRYQAYDVTGLLQAGENVLGAVLGDGWYCGHVCWFGRQQYGDRPKLLAQLEVASSNSERVTITTGAAWRTAFGPLLESDLLMGESYDARLELPGWDAPGYDDRRWLPAERFDDAGAALQTTNGALVRRQETMPPVGEPAHQSKDGGSRWLYDFGQNLVGHLRLKVSGPAGTTITLRHGEVLNPDGTLYTANLRSALASDHYTLRGGGEETYEPRFTFHGFRYVEVRGYPGRPGPGALEAIVLHSQLAPAGSFECSEPLINQLQHNIEWGQKGNFLDVPTDCPQRDERLGWTGDAQVFARTATFNRDVAGFFTKWLQDLADGQNAEGAFPPVAPFPPVPPNASVLQTDGGPAWADAGTIVPWTMYEAYGDQRFLETQYASMVRYVDYLAASSRDLIRCYPGYKGWPGFGDWLSINAETPKDLIGTAFFAHSAGLLARAAAVLGKADDAARFTHLHQAVRQAFIERYLTPGGLVAGQTQTACVLALHFDLLPAELRPAVVDALIRDTESRGQHLSTGFVGASYLPFVLSDNGQLDLAYKLLFQTTWPSWLYPVTQGATTIWERWDAWTPEHGYQDPGMNSFNHYAYGAVGDWLYRVVAGIQSDPEQPGYKHIILRPQPGGALTWARASYESPYGAISSAWRRTDEGLEWQVSIPPNSTASAHVPAAPGEQVLLDGQPLVGAVIELGAGSYEFRVLTTTRP
jgi:alpha-L-rhamnosidase